MALDRRRFLSLAAGLTAGAALPTAGTAPAAEVPGALTGPDGAVDWAAVRREFLLDPDWIHLSSFFLVSHPRPVREAIEAYRRQLDANPLWLETLFSPGDDNPRTRVKGALAAYLGASPDEIALTPNTTTGLALVYNGLVIRPDQEIVTTAHDHYVHHESIRRAAEKSGAAVRFVPLYERGAEAAADAIVDRVRRALGPRTRALGITWVHSSTGVKLPITAVAEVVAAANRGRAEADRCLLVVDGVHGFGVEDLDAAGAGADFFAAGTHKWLFGPRGTGVLWGRRDAWPQVRPTVPTFDLSDDLWRAWVDRRPLPPTRAAFVSPGGFVAYEHQFAVADALAFHRALGRGAVAARIRYLNARLREGLAAIPGVTLHTPLDPGLAAGICCFEVAGLAPDAVVTHLARRRIHATSSPYPVSYARLAAGVMNSEGELETAVAAVAEAAAGRGRA